MYTHTDTQTHTPQTRPTKLLTSLNPYLGQVPGRRTRSLQTFWKAKEVESPSNFTWEAASVVPTDGNF